MDKDSYNFNVKIGIFIFLVNLVPTVSILKDVVFAVERSSRFSSTDFHETIDFIHNVTELLEIGQNNTLVSVVTYSSSVRVEFALNDNTDKANLLSSIHSLGKVTTGGFTYTHLALDVIKQYVLLEQNGARNGAKKIVIVISKGVSNDTQSAIEAAGELRKDGVELISVAIGPLLTSRKTELMNIASKPVSEYVYNVKATVLLCDLVPVLQTILDPNITMEANNGTTLVNTHSKGFSQVAIKDDDETPSVDILVTVFVVLGVVTGLVFIYLITGMLRKPCRVHLFNKDSDKLKKNNSQIENQQNLYQNEVISPGNQQNLLSKWKSSK